MTFKKITSEELKYIENENVIGMTFERNFSTDKNETIERSNYFETFKGKKIPIIFQRTENLIVESSGDLKNYQKDNILLIKNTSERDKLWNLHLGIKGIDKEFYLSDLMPNDNWIQNLETNDENPLNNLKIYERISKSGYITDRNTNSEFFLEKEGMNEFYFTLFLVNNSLDEMSNISIKKELPNFTQGVYSESYSVGKLQINKKSLLWTISKLKPKNQATLKFKIRIQPKLTTTGKIHTSYQINSMRKPFYELDFFKCNLKAAQFIHIDEHDEKPGTWNCSISFVNRSEFLVEVNRVELFEIGTKEKSEIYNKETKLNILPYEEINLFDTTIESMVRPSLAKKIEFVPVFEIASKYYCNISLEEQPIDFIDLSANKEFSIQEINSFETTEFYTKINLRNHSTLPINHLFIASYLSNNFRLKDHSNVRIMDDSDSLSMDEVKNVDFMQKKSENSKSISRKISETQNEIIKFNEEKKIKMDEFKKLQSSLNSMQVKDLVKEKDQIASEIEIILEKQKITDSKDNDIQNKLILLKKDLAGYKRESHELIEIKKGIEQHKELNAKFILYQEELAKIVVDEEDLKHNQAEIAEKISEADDSRDIKTLKSENKSIKKKISSLKKNKTKIENEANKIQDRIKKIKNTIGKETSSSIKKKIDSQNKNCINAEENIIKYQNQAEEIKKQKKEVNELISGKNNFLKSLEKKINTKDGNIKDLKTIEKRLDEIENKLESLQFSLTQLKNQESKFNIFLKNSQSDEKILNFLLDTFKNNISNGDPNFDSFVKQDLAGGHWLYILINDLGSFLAKVDPGKEFSIEYPIIADKPNINKSYQFPCTIFYDTLPSKNVNSYKIPNRNLPQLKINHERFKISIGKVVDNYDEKGLFELTLLVRNKGTKTIENLQIIDYLPKDAEISNAFYNYSEISGKDGKKKIIWELEKINPLEEVEISYLVNLKQNSFDLNDFELVFK